MTSNMLSLMRLNEKVALVTGANTGIGKGIAARFAAEGARVAVNYFPNPTSAKIADAEVAAFPTPSMAVAADVTKRSDVEQMIAAIVARFGRIDIVVNNAGVEVKKPFLDATDDEWNKVIGV